MVNYLLLAASTVAATGKALFCKALGVGNQSAKKTLILNCKSFLVSFLCSVLLIINRVDRMFEISAFSIVLSVLFGISVSATQILQAKAMGSGPASIVTLIYSCGFLIPIFYGMIFWNERVSMFQWMGIGLLTVALGLIIGKKGEKFHVSKWFVFAIASMLGSGINAIFQKTHQLSVFADELPFFLAYSMLFSSVFTAVAALLIRDQKTEGRQSAEKTVSTDIWLPVCLGVSVGLLNFLNLKLAGKLPSVIHFPIYNVGSMLLTSGLSALIYKDKPNIKQGIGFALGIIAILIVGLF